MSAASKDKKQFHFEFACSLKPIPKKQMQWLLRSLCRRRAAKQCRIRFVLPAVAMVSMVVVLLTTADGSPLVLAL